MKSVVWALMIAIAVVATLTPLVRLLALRLGAVSPSGGRHVHERSIPRLGGIAMVVAFFAPLLILWRADAVIGAVLDQESLRLVGLFGGGLLMCAVGVIDDTRGLRALHKLCAQIAVALFAYRCGFSIHTVYVPFVGDLAMGVFAVPVTVLWIVGVVNAVNLIDGLDGLAAGVVFFAAITNLLVAWLGGAVFIALLSAATAGAVLGFLFYNFNPARIFMGDSGSYFLGFVLAVTSLISQKASTAVSLLVPVVALGVPIIDTLFAMVRRILERRPVFSPDRGHIHHRLLDMGITHRRAVLIIYGFSVAFTVAALGISIGRSWQVGAAMLGASAVLIGLVRFVGYFELSLLRSRQKARIRSRDAEMLRYALPRLPRLLEEARTEEELFERLTQFVSEADLGFVEVIEPVAGDTAVYRWDKEKDVPRRDMVTARFPIGRDSSARAALKFGWMSDYGDVSPQSDILLQVAADLFERNLVRLRSRLASQSSTESAPSSPPESVPAPSDQAVS
jgi:UDP-GlcNAc:undecaprenyl-phosphate/decaprenyl-phosphate GlcNAc-1-phosphate transferase